MQFNLNIQKAVEAAGVLLRLSPGKQMSYLRLIKLMYLADRQCLAETGAPITGDLVFAMKNGPVLSGVYDLIRDRHVNEADWSQYVKKEGYSVRLVDEPGVGELSRLEVKTLQEVWENYKNLNDWDLVEDVAHQFPEWKKNEPQEGSCREISVEDILDAVNMSKHKEAISRDAEQEQSYDRFFAELGE